MACRLAAAIVLVAACHAPAAVLALRVLSKTTCGAVTDRGTIDLARLGTATSKGLFTAYDEFNSTLYLWSPCVDYDISATRYEVSDFSKPNCRAFAMLQYEPGVQSCTLMGSQSSSKYVVVDDRLVLVYEHALYKVKIALQCSEDAEESWRVTAYDLFEPAFALRSPELCLGDEPQRSNRLSLFLRRLPGYGTSAVITLAVVAFLYVICGVTYKKLKYKAALRDSLPNSGFWYELPYLIRDGALFAVCRYKKRNTYSKIRDLEGKDDGLDESSSDGEWDYDVNPRATVPRFKDASASAASGRGARARSDGPESVALLHKPRDADESVVDPVDV